MSNYKRKDSFYEKAKSAGHRSRAFYKLQEINNKFGILRHGNRVLDLGAWPGGWVQAAHRSVGKSGRVVGIDLRKIEDFEADNIKVIEGDVRDEENLEAALEFAGAKFDLVISDMSPKITGIREVDAVATVGCAELAFWASEQTLREGGHFVSKVFKGSETEGFVKTIRHRFNKVKRLELKSTRQSSKEFYLIGIGFKPTESS